MSEVCGAVASLCGLVAVHPTIYFDMPKSEDATQTTSKLAKHRAGLRIRWDELDIEPRRDRVAFSSDPGAQW